MTFEESLQGKHTEILNNTKSSELKAMRMDRFARFSGLGFPNRKTEDWKYTSVQSIREGEFALPDKTHSISKDVLEPYRLEEFTNLVFVNGCLSEELTDSYDSKGFSIQRLSGDELAQLSNSLLKSTNHQNAFSYLNEGFTNEAIQIKVHPNTTRPAKLHIIHRTQATESNGPTFVSPRIHILVTERAGLTLTETFISDDTESFCNSLVDIELAPHSSMNHVRVFAEEKDCRHIGTTRLYQKKYSSFKGLIFSYGGKLVRHDLSVELQEEESFSSHKGLYIANDNQHVDHHSWINHLVGHCQTEQHYKGILDGKARAVFNGKVIIQKGAQKADSQQLNNNLLLSKTAEIDSKPELEVYADDVKATHGSTIGQLNEEEIFYLQTRAISKEMATTMISQGFAMDLLMTIEDSQVQRYCMNLLQRSLGELHLQEAGRG